ncbi:MAG: bifunctional glycosyltransferase family 2/GtrA family protein [Clostridiales bacterium]|nr:bifunctional glycosyltransferase family 2/GtrA family protein [Clostridiales bacterium]
MQAVVIIPALNPGQKLVRLASEISSLFSPRIVIVDDGSAESSADVFASLKSMGCDVLKHPVNLGKGAALKTGMQHVLFTYPDADGVVTADADGQHSPQDIFRLAQRISENTGEIVLGTRNFSDDKVPFRSKWGNRITSFVFMLKTGVWLDDTQTGLRAVPLGHMPVVLAAKGSRFEYEMNVLLLASKMNVPLAMVPIDTIYEDNNAHSHFRGIQDSARIYFDILKFGFSSVVCTVLDFGLFLLLTGLVFGKGGTGIRISTVFARVVSGSGNFLINRYFVFKGRRSKAPVKYFILFVVQMFLSAQLTVLLAQSMLAVPIAKLATDLFLFFLSFFIQKKFIFRKDDNA